MAYTNQSIIGAYNQAMAAGKSEGEFVSWANAQGVGNDQLMSARSDMLGGSAPATTNVVNTVAAASKDPYSSAQYDAARTWASGKNLDEILSKSSSMGLTADQVGKVLGVSGDQVYNYTGYGQGASGFNPDGSLQYQYGWANAANPSVGGLSQAYNVNGQTAIKDWTWDQQAGFKNVAPTPTATGTGTTGTPTGPVGTGTGVTTTTPAPTAPPTNQWVPSAPATGINLSQVQQAQQWSVQPNQTVQNQLQQIIANDSPLMQQARARALQQANERGLLNSSMAVTAGQSAVLDAAMPIAQQDASTFADAAKFNTGEVNTFARDNNAFTRDAFMADFNLAANEWAKTQDQYRLFDQMGYQQKLTLDRDAIQNGYQSARDAILNGYTVARDATTNQYTLQRDATQQGYTKANTADQNAFTKSQQDAQNAYAAAEAEKDRVATERRAAMGIQAPNPDTSVLRTQMQIDADTANRADSAKTTAQTNLYNAKTQWGSKIIDINTGNLTADQKTAALVTLTSTYSPIISSYAVQAGLDPAAEVVGLRYEAPAAGTTTTTTNVVNNVTQGGDGG